MKRYIRIPVILFMFFMTAPSAQACIISYFQFFNCPKESEIGQMTLKNGGQYEALKSYKLPIGQDLAGGEASRSTRDFCQFSTSSYKEEIMRKCCNSKAGGFTVKVFKAVNAKLDKTFEMRYLSPCFPEYYSANPFIGINATSGNANTEAAKSFKKADDYVADNVIGPILDRTGKSSLRSVKTQGSGD